MTTTMGILQAQAPQQPGLGAERRVVTPAEILTTVDRHKLFGSLDVKSLMQQESAQAKRCKYENWYFVDQATGELAHFNCHSWNCETCRKKLTRKWGHRFAAANPERWFTVTNVPGDRAKTRLLWSQFVRALRSGYGNRSDTARRFLVGANIIARRMGVAVSRSQWSLLLREVQSGHTLEYARVLERGAKTGMRHYHVLYKGQRISQLVVLTLAEIFGFGYVGHEGPIYSEGGAWYVAKYLGKSGSDAGWRKVSCSRKMLERVVTNPGDWALVSPGIYRSTVRGRRPYVIDRLAFRESMVRAGYQEVKHLMSYGEYEELQGSRITAGDL